MKRIILLTVLVLVASASSQLCDTVPEHQVLTISCPNGEVVTSVDYASYGTPTGGCSSPANSGCHASTSQAKVEEACLNRATCQIRASNGVFGDPCFGTFKRLTVQVTCSVPPPFDYGNDCVGDCMSVREHQTLTVGCSEGVISEVLFASYGKPSGMCGVGYNQGSCHATTSQSVVEAACLGQATCDV